MKVDHHKTAPGHATSRTLRGDAPPVYCLDSASENDQEPLSLPAKWVGWMGRLEAWHACCAFWRSVLALLMLMLAACRKGSRRGG